MISPSFRTLAVDEVEPLLGDPGTLIVDVREPHELEATGKIPGAIALPLGQVAEALVEGGALRDLAGGTKTVVFYCAAGARSARAAAAAAEAGIGPVVNMQGGFNAWAQAALPVED